MYILYPSIGITSFGANPYSETGHEISGNLRSSFNGFPKILGHHLSAIRQISISYVDINMQFISVVLSYLSPIILSVDLGSVDGPLP